MAVLSHLLQITRMSLRIAAHEECQRRVNSTRSTLLDTILVKNGLDRHYNRAVPSLIHVIVVVWGFMIFLLFFVSNSYPLLSTLSIHSSLTLYTFRTHFLILLTNI